MVVDVRSYGRLPLRAGLLHILNFSLVDCFVGYG